MLQYNTIMMQQMCANKWIIYAGLILVLAVLSGVGCGQNIFKPSSADSSQEQSQQASRQSPIASRFGAIHQIYADVYAEPDIHSERLTECIYGDVVRIVKEKGWWYSVKIGPYPELSGWIHKSAVTALAPNSLYLREKSAKTIVIRQNLSHVYIWPSHTVSIVMGTELPFVGESEQWYVVRLPTNDIGRIDRTAVYPSIEVQPLIFSKQEEVWEIPQQREHIVNTAQRFLGKVYIWGGTSPRGFDCSGLTYFVYKLNGIELPRVSWNQFRDKSGKKINKSQLEPGDLVFFQTYRKGASHVGIYIGDNQFIHASPSAGVTTSDLDEPYFKKRYVGAKSVFSTS